MIQFEQKTHQVGRAPGVGLRAGVGGSGGGGDPHNQGGGGAATGEVEGAAAGHCHEED